MKSFNYNRQANQKMKFFGIEMMEALIILGTFISLLLIGSILGSVLGMPLMWYYLAIVLLSIIGIVLLKKGNKKDHPAYLQALIAFHIFHPKKIRFKTSKLYGKKRRIS